MPTGPANDTLPSQSPRRHHARRFSRRRIVIASTLGIITMLAVALAGAITPRDWVSISKTRTADTRCWQLSADRFCVTRGLFWTLGEQWRVGKINRTHEVGSAFRGLAVSAPSWCPDLPEPQSEIVKSEIVWAVGWPIRSFVGSSTVVGAGLSLVYLADATLHQNSYPALPVHLLVYPDDGWMPEFSSYLFWQPALTHLPTSPLPLGILVNSAFFAACWWAALTAIAYWSARRARRLRRCASCNYSLAGLPSCAPCPECGNAAIS